MNILVVGGSQFLGRHIVMAALDKGYTVTLFNRGKTNPHLFPELEKLIGDRVEGNLDALVGRKFDAVIDISAYIPRVVKQLLETVETDHYTFISTISVYASDAELNQDESAGVVILDDPTTEEITGETYGGLKVLCETAAKEGAADPLIVRSGLIMGAYDHTNRFEYYFQRMKRGGKMIVPPADYRLQQIDGRDQAAWIIRCIEQNVTGTYNVTGHPVPLGDVLQTIKTLSGWTAEFIHIDGEAAATHNIEPWTNLPLWIPMEEYAGHHHFNIDKAVAVGLTLRPMEDTVQSILDWMDDSAYITPPSKYTVPLSAEDEAAVVAKLA